jgi:hypothetical protein
MRLAITAIAAAGLVLGMGDRASAQVIYYNTPVYYTSPFTPFIRTYSTPVMYSTYTSPIVVPTRFVYPPWGTVAYDYPPVAAGQVAALNSPPPKKATTTTSSGSSATSTTTTPPTGVVRAGYVQPYPAFRQIGYSTYSNAPLPIGGVYYSGDAYIPPSAYTYTPYPEFGPAWPYYYTPPLNYGAFATPYFQVQFGEGYGGWGWGRGWGGWAR